MPFPHLGNKSFVSVGLLMSWVAPPQAKRTAPVNEVLDSFDFQQPPPTARHPSSLILQRLIRSLVFGRGVALPIYIYALMSRTA